MYRSIGTAFKVSHKIDGDSILGGDCSFDGMKFDYSDSGLCYRFFTGLSIAIES